MSGRYATEISGTRDDGAGEYRGRIEPSRLLLALLLLSFALPAWPQPFIVGLVGSDEPTLAAPASRDAELTTSQIEAMVRRAVARAGGLADVIPDSARLVLLKPNGGARPGTPGVFTDPRVVRAVALLVAETVPGVRIYITAGSGSWISPDLIGTVPVSLHFEIEDFHRHRMVDGFELAGYRDVARELRGRGIDIECFDLNFDRAVWREPPGGSLTGRPYAIASRILEADAWIDIPVAKTHGAKITAAMKNMYGLLPGNVYGWNKGRGTDVQEGIPHAPRIVDESFVDLMMIAEPDFVVTDMIRGSEGGAFNDTYHRANVIVAGRDPIAADLVAARLMGFNPDDLEFAEIAARRGRGPGTFDNITVLGPDITTLVSRWVKAGADYGGEWQEQADYGKGPRRWSLYGPVDRDHEFADVAALDPTPSVDGWSAPVWFGHDRIDLDGHFDNPVRCAVYAWTDFTMPEDGEVRLWMGADEGLTVWIDGEVVYSVGYRAARRRSHQLGQIRIPWTLTAGEHRLIVRADQGRGAFEFSFNICEPIDDRRYAGNSYFGLTYHLPGGSAEEQEVLATDRWSDGGGFSDGGPLTLFFDPTDDQLAPDSLVLLEPPPPAYRQDFVGLAARLAGLDIPDPALDALSPVPFGMSTIGPDAVYDESLPQAVPYGPDLDQILRWLALDYWLYHGHDPRPTQAVFRGFLSRGYVPIRAYAGVYNAAVGYREGADGFELLLREGDRAWWDWSAGWWQSPWEDGTLWNPVFYTTSLGRPLATDALIDSLAGAALNMARWSEMEGDDPLRGVVTFPVGLAAWDESVIRWERQPLTPAWGATGRNRQLISWVCRRQLEPLAADRERAARFFEWAASSTHDPVRAQHLRDASEGFTAVARVLRDFAERLPRQPWGLISDEDGERLRHLGTTRGLLATARDAERDALTALQQMLDEPPLPPVRPNLLAEGYERRRLATIHASGGTGTHYVTLSGASASVQSLEASVDRDLQVEMHGDTPSTTGWRLELQQRRGLGAYRIVQRPAEQNGWRAEVRVQDTNRAWATGGMEIVVWAVRLPG